MILTKLALVNFRSFSSQQFEFSTDSTILFGPNGAGKTSVLEAIYYGCNSTTFKTNQRTDLIKFNEAVAKIRMCFDSGENIYLAFNHEKKIVKINGEVTINIKEAANLLSVTTLLQKDIELVIGYPENKRLFFSKLLCELKPECEKDFFRLKAILANRKKLLESNSNNKEEFDLWTNKLLEVSKKIAVEYDELITILNLETAIFFDENPEIKSEKIKLSQLFSQNYSKDLALNVEKKEFENGRNIIGIQSADFSINLGDKDIKKFGSRGQQKLVTFIIKVAACNLLAKKMPKNKCHILLCDDFFSEIDTETELLLKKSLKKINIQKIFTEPGSGTNLQLKAC